MGEISPIVVRAATVLEQPKILELLGEHMPNRDVRAKWEWMYQRNPEGAALTWAAFDEATGALAGATSYFPVRMWIDGEVVRGAIGGDGYVRPHYRRRGIAGRLHAALRAEMPKHGIETMFGSPATANITPLQAGGSRVITDYVRYLRPLTASAIDPRAAFADPIARRVLSPRNGRARLEPLVAGDLRADSVWRETRDELGISIVKDAAFLTWRFAQAPSGAQEIFVVIDGDEGRPIATCALQERGDRLLIVDLCAPKAAWGRALAAILRRAAHLSSVEIWLLREEAERLQLWRHGFIARDGHPYLVVAREGSQHSSLFDPRRWSYTNAAVDIDKF
jgi:GNAT superfamily N-acetyltransferase